MKVVLFANTDWYLYNFRRSLAAALRARGDEVVLLSPDGPYGEPLRALGFDWRPAPMDRRSLNPARELRLLAWLVQFMRAERPDIVHGFTIKSAVYGSLAARLAGAGRVNAVAGMGYVFSSADMKARVLRPFVRAAMSGALGGARSRLVLQNPDDAALMLRAGVTRADRIRLIEGSGVDTSRFLPPALRPSESGTPLRVILPARLLWDKGVAEFVEASRILRGEGRRLSFILAGAPDPGNPAAVPEATLNAWVADGLVEWLGHVSDMPALLASADLVVLPSYREGLPKSLIEAAACARPLITTDVPGCREVVTNEVDGLLVPMRQAAPLARAIARLQDDPDLARRLGEAARTKALSAFDERIVIEKTLAVYAELCDRMETQRADKSRRPA